MIDITHIFFAAVPILVPKITSEIEEARLLREKLEQQIEAAKQLLKYS